MDDDLTVGDLARAIAPLVASSPMPSDADQEFVTRRIRNWTLSGALKPVGGTHMGSGRHRRYDKDSIYVAAALSVLADNDQGIGTLLTVANFIRGLWGTDPLIAGPAVDHFRSAVAGKKAIFLVVGAVSPVRPTSIGDGRTLASMNLIVPAVDLTEALPKLAGGAFVNLTSTFKRLAL